MAKINPVIMYRKKGETNWKNSSFNDVEDYLKLDVANYVDILIGAGNGSAWEAQRMDQTNFTNIVGKEFLVMGGLNSSKEWNGGTQWVNKIWTTAFADPVDLPYLVGYAYGDGSVNTNWRANQEILVPGESYSSFTYSASTRAEFGLWDDAGSYTFIDGGANYKVQFAFIHQGIYEVFMDSEYISGLSPVDGRRSTIGMYTGGFGSCHATVPVGSDSYSGPIISDDGRLYVRLVGSGNFSVTGSDSTQWSWGARIDGPLSFK